MTYMSRHTVTIDSVYPEQLSILQLFTKANALPEYLTSHNSPLVQRAFLSVPLEDWLNKLSCLVQALGQRNNTAGVRKLLLKQRTGNLTNNVEQLLDMAFLEKYCDLTDIIDLDYQGFFPYALDCYNQKLFVFKKLKPQELTEYILTRDK